MVHRDIKPGNILFDTQGGICLSDFGIAKIAEATAAFTGTGIIGTPAYMAPEQAQGEKLDGRSDIYCLGVVLFQALSGELPFKANTPMGVAVAHITEPVPSLLARRADLPQGFEQVIHKTLDKNPARRYQTASELAQAINQAAKSAVDMTVREPVDKGMIEPRQEPSSVPSQPVAVRESISTTVPPQPSSRQRTLPKFLGAGGIGLLALCLCAGLISGFASGLIPNPFAVPPPTLAATDLPVSQPETSEPPNTPVTMEVVPTIVVAASATTFVEPTQEISIPTQAVLLPLFTAQTDMLCREGPSTTYVDRWQVLAGETVLVLAQWYQDSNWLLVDIEAPPTETRTDCCWVGGQGSLNVSLAEIRPINFLPDRLDCSALK